MISKRQSTAGRHRSCLPSRLKILFEDDHVLVVEKAAGLLTIGTEREKRHTAYAFLFDYIKSKRSAERIFIVHRLDRDASGLVVFAKSSSAKRDLQRQFREHSTGRTYLAVTEGRMLQAASTIQSWLAENAMHRCYSTSKRTRGKWAVTHVKVLKRSMTRTLVEVRLETGRKHQIRVHLAEAGHPIVGDRVYGSRTDPIRRLALHAARLTFAHPVTGQPVEFESAPPPLLATLI